MILGAFKSIKFWAATFSLLGVVSLVGFFTYNYNSTVEELGATKSELETVTKQTEQLNKNIKEDQQRNKEVRENKTRIQSQYNESIRELSRDKDNHDAVYAQPDEAEKRIEESFNQYMTDISCITGDTSQCSKQ